MPSAVNINWYIALSSILFTIGVLACAVPPMPKPVLAVPVLWCLVGAQAAFLLGVPQDLGLLAAAALGLAMLLRTGKALP